MNYKIETGLSVMFSSIIATGIVISSFDYLDKKATAGFCVAWFAITFTWINIRNANRSYRIPAKDTLGFFIGYLILWMIAFVGWLCGIFGGKVVLFASSLFYWIIFVIIRRRFINYFKK